MTTQVLLTKGKIALIDDGDAEQVLQYNWCASQNRGNWYASTTINGKRVNLHVLILNPPEGFQVDHIDRDGLNCRRNNLRPATIQQNAANRVFKRKATDFTSIYKGVRKTSPNRWTAFINKEGENQYLGIFIRERDAALAYDVAARRLNGEFAYLNFPDVVQETAPPSSSGRKLTAEMIPIIRADKRSLRAIAKDYGVHNSTISEIKTGRTWNHL